MGHMMILDVQRKLNKNERTGGNNETWFSSLLSQEGLKGTDPHQIY